MGKKREGAGKGGCGGYGAGFWGQIGPGDYKLGAVVGFCPEKQST